MRPRILYSVYNISGYLMAELAELSKSAEIAIIYAPYEKEYAEPRYPQYRWIRRPTLRSVADAMAFLDAWRPDVYICGGWSDPLCLELARRLHRQKVTTVVSIDTPWEGRLKQIVHCLISRFYLTPVFDCAWGAGEPQERYLRYLGFPRKRIRRGTYCADVHKFSPIGENRLRLKVEVENGRAKWPHTFLYIGRYVAVKNMRRMERAFLKAIKRMPESDWTLKCIGSGDLWNERTIHPRIQHLGWKTEDVIQNFVKDAGCFVLPSVYEPWGVVVHEAALMGLPMICSNQIQAATAFLKDGVNGYLFNPLDEGQMAFCFEKVMALSDKSLCDMGTESVAMGKTCTLSNWANTVLSFVK